MAEQLGHNSESWALALGELLSMIGKLLGNNKIDSTVRNAHVARDPIKASLARLVDRIGAGILDDHAGEPDVHSAWACWTPASVDGLHSAESYIGATGHSCSAVDRRSPHINSRCANRCIQHANGGDSP